MALYAIGDLHLSLSSNKPMEIFGDGWRDYVARIREGFSVLTEDDVTVLCGDLSWGMSLEESLEDFRFIDALPGKKYLLKGNHDYWWNTAAKMERFFREHELTTMEILHNNCKFYGELALCGTRGWLRAGQPGDPQRKGAAAGDRAAGELSEGGGGTREAGVSPLSAPVSGLPLPGDPAAAEGVRREAVLLRPSARRFPPPGHRGNVGWNGVFAGVGGLSEICSQKNLRMTQKRCGN